MGCRRSYHEADVPRGRGLAYGKCKDDLRTFRPAISAPTTDGEARCPRHRFPRHAKDDGEEARHDHPPGDELSEKMVRHSSLDSRMASEAGVNCAKDAHCDECVRLPTNLLRSHPINNARNRRLHSAIHDLQRHRQDHESYRRRSASRHRRRSTRSSAPAASPRFYRRSIPQVALADDSPSHRNLH